MSPSFSSLQGVGTTTTRSFSIRRGAMDTPSILTISPPTREACIFASSISSLPETKVCKERVIATCNQMEPLTAILRYEMEKGVETGILGIGRGHECTDRNPDTTAELTESQIGSVFYKINSTDEIAQVNPFKRQPESTGLGSKGIPRIYSPEDNFSVTASLLFTFRKTRL